MGLHGLVGPRTSITLSDKSQFCLSSELTPLQVSEIRLKFFIKNNCTPCSCENTSSCARLLVIRLQKVDNWAVFLFYIAPQAAAVCREQVGPLRSQGQLG